MNKKQFLLEVEQLLRKLPEDERKERLLDFQEHFQIGMENGKTEEEIAKDLGSPRTVSKESVSDYHMTKPSDNRSNGNMVNAVFVTLGLGIFNLIFALLPFLVIVGLLLTFYIVTITLLVAPFYILFEVGISDNFLPQLFTMMLTGGLGVLLGVGMIYATKGVYFVILRYIQINLNLIRRNM